MSRRQICRAKREAGTSKKKVDLVHRDKWSHAEPEYLIVFSFLKAVTDWTVDTSVLIFWDLC